MERAALVGSRGRFPSYEEWLASATAIGPTNGGTATDGPRRSKGATFEPPAPRDIRAFAAVVDGWKVHYHLAGAQRGPAFTDRGKTIDIHDSRNRENVLAALQLSAQKWGTISVTATSNSCGSVSNWRPSTASRSRTPSFRKPSPRSANGAGQKTGPTLARLAWGSSGFFDALDPLTVGTSRRSCTSNHTPVGSMPRASTPMSQFGWF